MSETIELVIIHIHIVGISVLISTETCLISFLYIVGIFLDLCNRINEFTQLNGSR
jgi:hypothetical protein